MKLLATLALALLSLTASAQREQTWVRKSQSVTLDLHWSKDHYGNIQWQKSTDDGKTWDDIKNATKPIYTFTPSQPTLLRAHIEGDPACPAIDIERDVQVMTLDATVTATYSDGVDMEISLADLPLDLIQEYGYTYNMSALSHGATLMPRTKVGERPEASTYEMHCTGLLPKRTYSVRAYVALKDGTVIYGAGKAVNTIPGLEWHSEDWSIGQRTMQARFVCPEGTRRINFELGSDEDDMTSYTATSTGDKAFSGGTIYATPVITGLTPATDYIARVTAIIDGEEVMIEKTVRTMTDYTHFATPEDFYVPVGHRIDWGERKFHRISMPENTYQVEYPRMVRAADGTLILTYHGGTSDHWQNCYIRRSYDDGVTWTDQQLLYSASGQLLGSGYYRICNPQVTLLDNGWLILSVCGNATPETNYNCKVFTSISKDNGETWGDPVVVCRGRTWEPHVVQLPGGELELLVSSEAPWWGKDGWMEQEIVYARSTDYGQTWTTAQRACYLPGARDGMPVPIVLKGNRGVIFSIESVGSGLPPSLVYRPLHQEWNSTPWNRTDSDRRWLTNLNGGGGAPYCVQIPSGELIIMAHTNQAGQVWQTCRPQVVMADSEGKNPKYKTVPAGTSGTLNPGEGAYYNSLFMKDDTTVWLLVTRATYNGDVRQRSSIEYMEGKIIPAN